MPDITTWPWPRILTTQWRSLLLTKQSTGDLFLSELSRTITGSIAARPLINLGDSSEIDSVDLADFGHFYVISTLGVDTNGLPVRQTFYRDVTTAEMFTVGNFPLLSAPSCGTVCNFNGQFLGANLGAAIDSPWYGLGTRGLIWSGIGNFTLNPSTDIVAGYRAVFAPNTLALDPNIYRLLPVGNSVVAYSDIGLVLLQPKSVGNTFTYEAINLPGLGIRSGNHVAGNNALHGFVDLVSDFWLLEPNGRLTKRGYREFIQPMIEASEAFDTRLIVSYLPQLHRFYLSNGLTCLVINDYGAYTTHQMVSSVAYAHTGLLYGTFSDTLDRDARITTDTLDYNSRGLKSVESLLVGLDHSSSARTYFSSLWRMSKSAPFSQGPWRPAGPTGEAKIGVSALDFRLRVRVTEYADVKITHVLSNVKFADQRFKRGTVPAQYSA